LLLIFDPGVWLRLVDVAKVEVVRQLPSCRLDAVDDNIIAGVCGPQGVEALHIGVIFNHNSILKKEKKASPIYHGSISLFSQNDQALLAALSVVDHIVVFKTSHILPEVF
jgi:hypothetical protein